MQIRIFISLYASLQYHIILQKSFQYVDLLSKLFFLAFYLSKESWTKCHRFQKILNSKNISLVINQYIRMISEGSVTLKTGVTADENSDLNHWIKLYAISKYRLYKYIYIYNLTHRRVKTPQMTATEHLKITKQMHIDGSSFICSAKCKQM